jgi:hypothetical protein
LLPSPSGIPVHNQTSDLDLIFLAGPVIAFPVGVSREEFLKTARSSRKAAISSCRFEPMDEDDVEEIELRSPGWKARKAEKAANRSATAINSDLRKERREDWRHADRVTGYWRARLDWNSALSSAQSWGIADSVKFPAADNNESRWKLVDTWREAVVKQLLTASPDLAAINWKRAKLASRDFAHLPTKVERIERAIAEDMEWLAAHPTKRTGNVEACAKSRAFKEAMRQRIREIAASRDLTDEDIKLVLRLKHAAIGHFCQAHGVNIGWLLEGVGPIFKPWPTS